jgi:hypothetical protein
MNSFDQNINEIKNNSLIKNIDNNENRKLDDNNRYRNDYALPHTSTKEPLNINRNQKFADNNMYQYKPNNELFNPFMFPQDPQFLNNSMNMAQ